MNKIETIGWSGANSLLVKVQIENFRMIEFCFHVKPDRSDAKLHSFRAYHAYNNSKASVFVLISEMEEAQNTAVLETWHFLGIGTGFPGL